MYKILISLLVFTAFSSFFALESDLSIQNVQPGDIIFQTSGSDQSKAIQLATKSKYSHVGIIFKDEGQFVVLEAVQPVKTTPLADWIKRGKKGHYVVKRLKNADSVLTSAALTKMKNMGERFVGKDYDIYFGWSDDKLYCSELVWKIYKEATGIEIGALATLGSFDLSSELVKRQLQERYGDNVPLDEQVISPEAMFSAENLINVARD